MGSFESQIPELRKLLADTNLSAGKNDSSGRPAYSRRGFLVCNFEGLEGLISHSLSR